MSSLEFVKVKSFMQKNYKFWNQKFSFHFFKLELQKNHCQIWNQNLQCLSKCKQSYQKKCLILVFFGWSLRKPFSYLKLKPRNLSIQNERTLNVGPKTAQLKIFESFIQKEKTLNVGPKMSYLGILGWNLKKLFSYLKSTPSILSKTYFNQCNKF